MKHYEEKVNKLLQVVINEAKSINIPISDNICSNVLINKRAKKRFGACKTRIYKNKKHFQIEIGSALNICEDNIIKTVLMHEILHTCENCNNHGKLWKQYAKKVNIYYGYNIKTSSTYEEYGLSNIEAKETYRYKIRCIKCNNLYYRMRKSSIIKNIDRYRCVCGGKLIVEDMS